MLALSPSIAPCQDTRLAGIWSDKHCFGPELRGELLVHRTASGWEARIAGRYVEYRGADDRLVSDSRPAAHFAGAWTQRRRESSVTGSSRSPQITGERYATPLALVTRGENCYSGPVAQLEDTFTVGVRDHLRSRDYCRPTRSRRRTKRGCARIRAKPGCARNVYMSVRTMNARSSQSYAAESSPMTAWIIAC